MATQLMRLGCVSCHKMWPYEVGEYTRSKGVTPTSSLTSPVLNPGVAWKNIGVAVRGFGLRVAVGSAGSSPDWPFSSTQWDHN